MIRSDPEEPFGAQDTLKIARIMEERPEFLCIERTRRLVNKTRDPILFCLGHMLAGKFTDPSGRTRRLVVIKQARTKNSVKWDLPLHSAVNVRSGVERTYNRFCLRYPL